MPIDKFRDKTNQKQTEAFSSFPDYNSCTKTFLGT